jgi:hypothetical protein
MVDRMVGSKGTYVLMVILSLTVWTSVRVLMMMMFAVLINGKEG